MVAAAGAGERLRADPQRFAERMGELSTSIRSSDAVVVRPVRAGVTQLAGTR